MKPKPRRSRKPRFHKLKNHPFVIPVVTFVVLFFVALAGYVSLGGQTVGASDSRVVVLQIDGKEQTIPTRAQTVKELLDRLEIPLAEKDLVEPGLDTPIEEDNLRIAVYKARPVLIEDGDNKIVLYTAAPSPQAIAKEAGLVTYPEDKLEAASVESIDATNLLREGIVAERVVINRAKEVFLNLYGTPIAVRTQADTVGELLAEKNVVLEDEDSLQPEITTTLAANTQVFVIRMGKQIVSEEATIPQQVETVNDPNLPVGTSRVQQAGVDGRKVVTYEIELQNGQEVARKVIQEIIASAPVKRVVVKGTKVVISNPSANVDLGQQIAGQMGWGHQFHCIYEIFQRESKWNHLARNRSSGAYGIPQALPGSKMGPGWESDPAVQIRWGINYMAQRYGSPCRAYDFWLVNRWY